MTNLTKYLAEVRERVEKATPGPWCWNHCGQLGIPVTEGNFHFINHARTDIPQLLKLIAERDAEIAKKMEELQAKREELSKAKDPNKCFCHECA